MPKPPPPLRRNATTPALSVHHVEEANEVEQRNSSRSRDRADSLDEFRDPGERVYGGKVEHIRTGSTNYSNSETETTARTRSNTSHQPSIASNSSVPSEYPKTLRFSYSGTTDSNNSHLILTGREKFTRCIDEPLHCPGAVQAFGVIVCVELIESRYVVKQVSENCEVLLGFTPAALFEARCLTEIFESEELRENLELLVERDSESEGEEVVSGADRVEILENSTPLRFDLTNTQIGWTAYCTIHQSLPFSSNRFIIELEPFSENDFKKEPIDPADKAAPVTDQFGEEFTAEEIEESTGSIVPPIRELIRMKRKRTSNKKSGNELQLFELLSQINFQLKKPTELDTFCRICASIFRELTEYDRVMIYQFDEEFNGCVVAESLDKSASNDIYKSLNFPHTDIPPAARALYQLNRIRILGDRDKETARIVCRDLEEVNSPLDMTKSYLRAVSPIHLAYLKNMNVVSTMAATLMVRGKFWGMIVCHGYGKAFRPSGLIRDIARLLASDIGVHIERFEIQKRNNTRNFIDTTPSVKNPNGNIRASSEDLLDLFKSDYGVLSIGNEAKLLGSVNNSKNLLALLTYLRRRAFDTITSTNNISLDYPDLANSFSSSNSSIAGFFLVPLSRGGQDFVVFVRKPRVETIRWAGSKVSSNNPKNRLEPRTSFKTFVETIEGKSCSWHDIEDETPQVLLLIFGRFIDLWREKESLLHARKLVEAISTVQAPLNEILNYLELALGKDHNSADNIKNISLIDELALGQDHNSVDVKEKKKLDVETRDSIVNSYNASKSLVLVINDLLNLNRGEENCFNLHQAILHVSEPFTEECEGRGITFEISEVPTGTPHLIGNQNKVSKVISELLSNAIQNTGKGGSIKVTYGELADEPGTAAVDSSDVNLKADSIRIGIDIKDTGVGISPERLERLFREIENVSEIDKPAGGSGKNEIGSEIGLEIGLGLSFVATAVKELRGQLRVTSSTSGSVFKIILPFRISNLPQNELHIPIITREISDLSSSSNQARLAISNPAQSESDNILDSLSGSLTNLSSRRVSNTSEDLPLIPDLAIPGFETSPRLSVLNLAKNSLLNSSRGGSKHLSLPGSLGGARGLSEDKKSR